MQRQILKADHFGRIELCEEGGQRYILRDTTVAQFGLRWFARWVAGHEARSLRALAGLPGVPSLLQWDGRLLKRSFIGGATLCQARPHDPSFYRAAHRLLKAMRARGVAHNDLAKEPNWLVTEAGTPAVVDFQMGWVFARRPAFFRLLAREDLRHLLKHKRHYCPQRMTPIEQRLLASRSWLSSLWKASGKRLYTLITRRLLNWKDNEGRGGN